MSVSISSLSFEHHENAFGIAETVPRISWQLEGTATNWEQSSYDLEITRGSDGVPRIYNVDSEQSILVPWPDEPLSSSEKATVRARAHGKDSQPTTNWSDTYSVETGLLNTEDWGSAIPIAADRETEHDLAKRPVMFRKTFHINSTVSSARLHITALGLYVAELNGERVGDHVLAPGYMAYQHRHTYDTYDVTGNIKEGDNVVGATVGEGWWAGRFAFLYEKRNIWGDTLGLLAHLVVTFEDGTKQTISTDLSWRASANGPTITSNIYDGELYNSTLEIPGWSQAAFNDSEWLGVNQLPPLKGHLTSRHGPPMRRIEIIKPQKILKTPSGKSIIDFGQNLVGWLRLNVSGPAGTNITMVHAEVMENDELGTRPLRTAKQTDTLILSGKDSQVWEPQFTFHGFRYVQIEGFPDQSALQTNVAALVVHSDMKRTGYFKCSNDLLNRFHQNVVWSMKGNFLDVPTDCPQRDERLGWTGDAHAFMPTSNFLYHTPGFWRAWLKDLTSDASAGGRNIPPEYVPTDDIALTKKTTSFPRRPLAVWGDVIVANPWALYLTTGDKKMLEEQYSGAKGWIDHGIPRNEAGLWNRTTFQYSDWLDPKAPPEEPGNATTHKHLVADAYLIQMTRVLANISSTIGQNSDAEKYTSDRATLVSAFQEAWIQPFEGVIANVTQTALALGLRFDIFDSGTRIKATQLLHDIIANNSYHIGTGFAGTQQLGFALSSVNMTDTFYKMLLQTTVPSWLYQVVMGGTTTWERWDSIMPNGSVNSGEMTSFNHYAFGSVADWMHQKIGGLAPGAPGWKVVRVEPEPGGNITSAWASFLSPYGQVNSSWWVNNEGFYLSLSLPPNTRAEIKLPSIDGHTVVGSGEHDFTVPGYSMPS